MKLNKVTYLLICLIEEAAEVIQRACKAIRFGLDEIQPGQLTTNKKRLDHELNDLHGVLTELYALDVVSGVNSTEVEEKREKLDQFMNYSREIGILEQEKQ